MNLINIWEWTNNTLFDQATLPATINKETLVNFILSEYGEYTPITDDPDFFKLEIANWFAVNYDNFNKMSEALELQYNAIENYDRQEDSSGTNKNKTLTTNTNKVSAFDSDTFSDSGLTDSDSNSDNSNTYTSHIHGNIGVTTSQQMLESEIHLREKYNIYKIIAVDFFKQFMLHCL